MYLMALYENHVKSLYTKTTVIASLGFVDGASLHHFSGIFLAGIHYRYGTF